MKDEKFQILKLGVGTFQPLSVVFVSETIRDIEIWDEWTQYYFCKATTNGYLVHESPINRVWSGYFLGQLVLRTMWTIVTLYIPVNPPLCTGVSHVRALSPAWTGSPARETLISRTHLFLLHDLLPTKKSSTIKSWPTFCDQYFWKFPIWNSRADKKRREIRMVKVFKWYPVIDLFDTFTGKLGHGD